MNRQVDKYKKGFTLIELVVVIAILGILFAIVVPRLTSLADEVRAKADQASLVTLNKATILYRISKNVYSDDVFADIEISENKDENKMQALVDGGFLEKIIKAQKRGSKFRWGIYEQKWGLDIAMSKGEASAKGFNFSEETGTITEYKGTEKDVHIPYEIGGVLVTEIGEKAFFEKELKSVKIPDSVKRIQMFAFYNNKLKEIEIPSGVVFLGRNSFAGNDLVSVYLGDTVQTIGDYAFSNNQVEEINFPSSVKTIGSYAFEKNKLKRIIIPETVESMHSSVFIKNMITLIEIKGKPKNIHSTTFNQNGPNSDKDITISVDDCPVKYKIDSNGEWAKQQ